MGKITQIKEVPIWKLKPYEKNAKMHSEEQVQKIAESIKEFGFLSPCLIDKDYNIIAGHGRVEASKLLAMENIPCVEVEGLTDAQRRAYILADNKLTELGEWDWNIVNDELEALSESDFDIGLTGFSLSKLDGFDDGFSLPSGDKPEFCTMTFTLHEKQKELIEYAMQTVKGDIEETFGNQNSNGNSLYEVIRQWAEQRK